MREVMYKLKDGTMIDTLHLHNAFHVIFGNDGYLENRSWENWEKANTGEYINFLNNLFEKGSIIWYGFPTFDELVKGKNSLYAIKMYRDDHNCTLREAKDYVDSLTV